MDSAAISIISVGVGLAGLILALMGLLIRGQNALREDNKVLRAEMREDIYGLRAEMREDNKSLRAEMHEDNKALRADLYKVRDELNAKIDRVHDELSAQISHLTDKIVVIENRQSKLEGKFEQMSKESASVLRDSDSE